jgi:hypothetical protein
MTSYNTEELATRVLKDLGLVASEETPSAADLTWAVETCEAEIGMLAAKGVPIWNGSEDDVPAEYLTALSRRIGLAVAPSFGLISIAEAEQAMPLADANLRILGMTPGTGVTMEAEYF